MKRVALRMPCTVTSAPVTWRIACCNSPSVIGDSRFTGAPVKLATTMQPGTGPKAYAPVSVAFQPGPSVSVPVSSAIA